MYRLAENSRASFTTQRYLSSICITVLPCAAGDLRASVPVHYHHKWTMPRFYLECSSECLAILTLCGSHRLRGCRWTASLRRRCPSSAEKPYKQEPSWAENPRSTSKIVNQKTRRSAPIEDLHNSLLFLALRNMISRSWKLKNLFPFDLLHTSFCFPLSFFNQSKNLIGGKYKERVKIRPSISCTCVVFVIEILPLYMVIIDLHKQKKTSLIIKRKNSE